MYRSIRWDIFELVERTYTAQVSHVLSCIVVQNHIMWLLPMYGQGPGPLSIASDAMHRRGSNDMRFNAQRSGSMTIDRLECIWAWNATHHWPASRISRIEPFCWYNLVELSAVHLLSHIVCDVSINTLRYYRKEVAYTSLRRCQLVLPLEEFSLSVVLGTGASDQSPVWCSRCTTITRPYYNVFDRF